jgi:hypothetical protein
MLPDGYKAEPRPNGKDGHRGCRLKAMRGPGESYSDVIIRLAKGEGGDLMTTH